MAAPVNPAPIIIKRKKVIAGGGHHGGAWKVAYADFVTAMMAFFMLMWLLNATTEQQRKGIADYFTPTIPINRISGGGDGAFGGDSIFSENVLPKNGTGGSTEKRAEGQNASGTSGAKETPEGADGSEFDKIQEVLAGRGGESEALDNALRNIVSRITDEGMVIEVFETEENRLFEGATDRPTQVLRDLAGVISETASLIDNEIAIEGHVSAQPIVVRNAFIWDRSAARAMTLRELMQNTGLNPLRFARMTGHADRRPINADPMNIQNNRITVILLRDPPPARDR